MSEAVSPDPRAELLKEEANICFRNKKYDEAITLYTEAIKLDPLNPIYYSNRSIAYLNIDWFGRALVDATNAILIDPKYVKAYYRRAAAHTALGRFKLALRDYEAVCKARPSDKDALAKFNECNKLVKKIAFEKAISISSAEKSVAESIDVDCMIVEDDYTGPIIEDNRITLSFVKTLMECFKKQERLHRKYAYKILLEIKAYFDAQPTLININVEENKKFTVCGDIHGQFYDLLNIFELNGLPSPENPYLFNGDFVDRGSFSVECIFTLFSLKLLYPDHFFMSRGNHESQTMNQMYGFDGEVKAKYTEKMANLFTEVYNTLPLAHCFNNRVLVMHGGLFSEDNVTLENIRNIDRKRQPPEEGLMCELLWSDPQPGPGRAPSKRGVGIQFGPDITKAFVRHNNLDYIIRSHEVKQDGYEVAHDGKCITVFSAPNYCDTMKNKGAFITLTGKDMEPTFTTYEEVPHPNIKPMMYANSLLNIFNL